jgi:hypothetical protein
MNATSYQGYFPFTGANEDDPRRPFGRGDYAYVATYLGMRVVNISAALDENSLTTVDQNVENALYERRYAKDVEVHGSYAVLVTGGIGGGLGSLDVVDVSDPLNPNRMGTLSIPSSSTLCYPYAGARSHQRWTSVSVRGTRAYVSGASSQFLLIELE